MHDIAGTTCTYSTDQLGYDITEQGLASQGLVPEAGGSVVVPDGDVDCTSGWTEEASGITGICTANNPVVLGGCNKDSCDAPPSQVGYEITAGAALPASVITSDTGASPTPISPDTIGCSDGYTLGADGIQAACTTTMTGLGHSYILIGCNPNQ